MKRRKVIGSTIGLLALSAVCGLHGCTSREQDDAALPTSPGEYVAEEQNHEWFIFLAKPLRGRLAEDLKRELAALVGKVAKVNDVVHVIAAPEHSLIATINVARGVEQVRIREAGSGFRRIATFLDMESGQSIRGTEGNDNHPNQLQIPAVSSTIVSFRQTDFAPRVILVGDPVYCDERQSGWSFGDGMVPTDAALTDAYCPFGNGVTKFPEGTEVKWVTTKAGWGTDNVHRAAIGRFVQAFFQKNDAQLVRITADAHSAFSSEGARLARVSGSDGSAKAEMRLVTRASKRTEPEASPHDVGVDTGTQQIINAVEPEPQPQPEPESPSASPATSEDVERRIAEFKQSPDKIFIAINWTSQGGSCDLDLHISDNKRQGELSFSQMTTEFGRLYRDVTSAGTVGGDDISKWECAEINHDRLGDLRTWIHVFSSTASSEGKMVVVWKGKRREFPFRMTGEGTRGGSRRNNPRWKAVSPLNLFRQQRLSSEATPARQTEGQEQEVAEQKPPFRQSATKPVPAAPAFLGIRGRSVSGKPGVQVAELQSDGAAKTAGIAIGDHVTKADDTPINSMENLIEFVNAHRPDDSVTLTVQNDSLARAVVVRLGRWTEEAEQSFEK